MNASLLSAIQSEPWSLVLLGAVLFALSSIARRKSVAAGAVKSSNATAVTARSETANVVLPRTAERADASPRPALHPTFESGLNTAA
jgi:hypothetical protein